MRRSGLTLGRRLGSDDVMRVGPRDGISALMRRGWREMSAHLEDSQVRTQREGGHSLPAGKGGRT